MINLKTEEFVLDGPPLQSLQQLIQWVGDFVLYLLANLPNQVSSGRVHYIKSELHKGATVSTVAVSQFQGLGLDPEIRLLTVWSFSMPGSFS